MKRAIGWLIFCVVVPSVLWLLLRTILAPFFFIFKWVGLPLLIIATVAYFWRKIQRRKNRTPRDGEEAIG